MNIAIGRALLCAWRVSIVALAAVLSAPARADIIDGLVLYYPFDGNADDASGNHNDGKVTGARLARDRDGVSDAAYRFTAPADMIVADYSEMLEPQEQITVAAWVWLAHSASRQRIVDDSREDENTKHEGYSLSVYTLKHSRIQFCVWASGYHNCAYAPAIPKKWHFYVGTYDAALGQTKMYLDGALYFTLGSGTRDIRPAHQNFAVGNSVAGQWPFQGRIDEVRVYDRTLSDDDVQELYNADSTRHLDP